MDVALVLLRKNKPDRRFGVKPGESVIGRREDCALRVPLGDVSRQHCRLTLKDDTIHIEDLGSSNGTYVNRKRVQTSPLEAGDVVRVGSLKFLVQVDGKPDQPLPKAAKNDEPLPSDMSNPLAPTAQSEAGDGPLDPSDAASVEDLMSDD